jgi:outer membrane receptor for ferrienterochelin and colicin
MKLFITAWLMLPALVFCGQGLKGKVLADSSPGNPEPLPGALVVWEGTRSGTVTSADGTFSIGIPPNAGNLIVSYIGFITDTIPYIGQKEIQVKLLPANSSTSQIDVVGESSSTHINTRDPMNFQTLNEKELCKAACCNLSESFETNASIDATFADAVTGTRQIRMLGLDGRYTQMMFDNMPAVRGLSSTYGLTYVPGPWVKNIYIAKGVGSVVGGFESITGQINVAIKNPDNAERLHVNAYAGNAGRTELNLVWRPEFHGHDAHDDGEDHEREEGDAHDQEHHGEVAIHPVFLAHGAVSQLRTDMNGDGFLDNPLFSNIILRNEWHIEGARGLGAQIVLNYVRLRNVSGKLDYDPLDEVRSQLWGVDVNTDRYEFTAKAGYVFPGKPWKSFGSQWSASWHDQNGKYGFRRYKGSQLSGRVNLLYASRIGSDKHKFTTGVSYMYDDYVENITFSEIPIVPLSSMQLNRLEYVPGAFAEYTMNPSDKFTLVGGIRGDYHNVYGVMVTPRLHARISFAELTSLKLVAGRGFRTANVLMDNVGILAGNRNIVINGNDENGIYGLKMEDAWNTGAILSHKFEFAHRPGSLTIDAYHTRFSNQVVLDLETPGIAEFYNLDGESFSNSAQIEAQWSPIRRLEVRSAYRWLEAKTQFTSGMKERPLVNRHRAFMNLAFETKAKPNGAQWRFDCTVQWISRKRLPYQGAHLHHPEVENTESQYTPDYYQLMAQVTYVFRKNLELYLGGENLTNFMVHDAIIDAENPNSELFDGSLLWGPVFGRMGYLGFRWIIPSGGEGDAR